MPAPCANAAPCLRFFSFKAGFSLVCTSTAGACVQLGCLCVTLICLLLRHPAVGQWPVTACLQAALPAWSWVWSLVERCGGSVTLSQPG